MGMLYFIDFSTKKTKIISKEKLANDFGRKIDEMFANGRTPHTYAILWSDRKNSSISTFVSEPEFVRKLNEATGDEITVFYAEQGTEAFHFEPSTGYQEAIRVHSFQNFSLWPELKSLLESEDSLDEELLFPCISLFTLVRDSNGDVTPPQDAHFFPLYHDEEINFKQFMYNLLDFFQNASEAVRQNRKMGDAKGLTEQLSLFTKSTTVHGKGIARSYIYKKVSETFLQLVSDSFL
jgi:hypothetical protein